MFSLIILFSFCSTLSAQIPINGFCKLTKILAKNNYTSFSAIDYNLDGYRDLILFSPTQNNYCSIAADSRIGFKKPKENYSNFSITDIISYNSKKNEKKYLAISKKSKETGVVSFTRGGNYTVSSKHKFNGSSTTIDAGKVDDSSNPAMIFAGSGIDGLVITKLINGRNQEVDRIKGKMFSAAVFIDLNYDGYDDVVATDLTSNSIVFYNNDSFGSFEETRSIGLGSEIKHLNALEFNSDKFTDLVYIKNNKLEVFLGDSVSSFQNKIVINAPSAIEKYSILDYNGDGYNDIAFIDINKSKLSIMFAKSDNTFFEPITYVTSSNLCDIISYVDRNGRKLAALSSDGNVYVISTLSIQDDLFQLAASEKAISIQSFDYDHDKYKEFAFIDEGSHSLKIGLSERRNMMRTLYSINLSTKPEELVIDDSKKSSTIFICYKIGTREVEIIRYNFDKNKLEKQILYVNDPVKEVKYITDRLKDIFRVCVLTIKNKALFLQEFEIRNFKVSGNTIKEVARNVEDATFNYNIYKDIYAMIRFGNNVDLVKIVFDKKEIERIPKLTFQLSKDDIIDSHLLSINTMVNRSKPAAALLTFKSKSVLYYFQNDRNGRIELKNKLVSNPKLEYFVDDQNVSFYTLSMDKKNVFEVKLDTKSTKKIARIDENNINDYFITTLNGKNKSLVYIGGENNTITIKKYL